MSMAVTRTQSRVWVADNGFSFPQSVGKKWQLVSLTNLSWTGQHIIPKDKSNSPPSSVRNWCTAGLSYSLTFLLSFIWATDIIPLNMDFTSTFTGLPAKAFPPHSLQTQTSLHKQFYFQGSKKWEGRKKRRQEEEMLAVASKINLSSASSALHSHCAASQASHLNCD